MTMIAFSDLIDKVIYSFPGRSIDPVGLIESINNLDKEEFPLLDSKKDHLYIFDGLTITLSEDFLNNGANAEINSRHIEKYFHLIHFLFQDSWNEYVVAISCELSKKYRVKEEYLEIHSHVLSEHFTVDATLVFEYEQFGVSFYNLDVDQDKNGYGFKIDLMGHYRCEGEIIPLDKIREIVNSIYENKIVYIAI